MFQWHGYKPRLCLLCSRLSQVRSGHQVCTQTDKTIAALPLQKGQMIKDSYREQNSLTNVLLDVMPFKGHFNTVDITIDLNFFSLIFKFILDKYIYLMIIGYLNMNKLHD